MLQLDESHSLFHTLCVMPEVRFENQKPEEIVLLTLRSHPIVLIPPVINSIIIFICIFLSSFLFGQFLNVVQMVYLLTFFFFVAFVYLWLQVVNWYFNMGIITNKQIVDVDFSALTYRNVSRTELNHIEDITVKVSGFASSIFDYGNIFVQTAGSEINTEFLQVPHPARAAHIIQDILKEYGANK